MVDPIRELKVRAEILQGRVSSNDARSLERLRALPELRKASPDALATFAAGIQRKHCLAIVAREFGFSGYTHAQRVLSGDASEADFGSALYRTGSGTLNHWYASYDEARALREEIDGYLLAYKRHFFIVDTFFIQSLGLDPEDPDWTAIGRDWVKPKDPDARKRLYGKLFTASR